MSEERPITSSDMKSTRNINIIILDFLFKSIVDAQGSKKSICIKVSGIDTPIVEILCDAKTGRGAPTKVLLGCELPLPVSLL